MKKYTKLSKKITALILTLTLTVTGLSPDVIFNNVNAEQTTSEITKDTPKENKVTVIKEMLDERTADSSTYLMSDGSKKTELYAENIRYKENGQYIEYNTVLEKPDSLEKQYLKETVEDNKIFDGGIEKSYSYVNASGDARHYFPEKLTESVPVILTKDNYVISVVPVNADAGEDMDAADNMETVSVDSETAQTNKENELTE